MALPSANAVTGSKVTSLRRLNVSNVPFAITYSSASQDHHLLEKSMMSAKMKRILMKSRVMMRKRRMVGRRCFWKMMRMA